jgi:hypothetical protein
LAVSRHPLFHVVSRMLRSNYRDRETRRVLSALLKQRKPENNSPDSVEKSDSLTILRNLIFFVAIYLYFIGWTYSYYLYSHFGVSLYSLDIPFYYFFIYSYSVVFSNSWWFVVAVGGFLITLFILRQREELRRLAVVLFLLVFFPLSFELSRNTAFESALLLRKGYGQTIKLAFKETVKETLKAGQEKPESVERQSISKNYPPEIVGANDTGELRLLTQTKDKFFVLFQPPPEREGGELPMCYTYVIAAADVSLTTIEAQNTPNVEVKVQNIPR